MNLLIVGKTSYIGTHMGQYILTREPDAAVTYLSVRNDDWKTMDLSGYDAVIFAAAIVHRKDIKDPDVYHRVNTLLPFEFAKKAKAQGVGYFVFLSTAAVYGVEKRLPHTAVISADTPLNPVKPYGKSKLEAEKLLHTLEDDDFLLSVIRTINVYGKDCPGNYISQFMKIAKLLPVHPKAFPDAKQGFAHVDSLSRLAYLILKSDHGGTYHAQDPQTVSAFDILQSLSKGMGIKRWGLPCQMPMSLFSWFPLVVKFFGGVAYDPALTQCDLGDYHAISCMEGLTKLMEE